MPVGAELDGNEAPANLVGVTRGFQEIRKLVILHGRYFEPSDTQTRSKVCLITSSLAKRISPGEDPVGKSIRLGDLRFDIIGVFMERVTSFGMAEIQRESVLVPFELMKYLTGEDKVALLYVQARTPNDVSSVTQSVARLLKSRHPGPSAYRVQNLEPMPSAPGEFRSCISFCWRRWSSVWPERWQASPWGWRFLCLSGPCWIRRLRCNPHGFPRFWLCSFHVYLVCFLVTCQPVEPLKSIRVNRSGTNSGITFYVR
jgi:hypothetical protein